jgi:uncharacterized RDD family membrane protein YckC
MVLTCPVSAAPALTPPLSAATAAPPGAVQSGAVPSGDRLVSGEAVELEVRVARLGSRALALILDIMVQVALLYALGVGVGLAMVVAGGAADAALAIALYTIVVALVLVGYPTLSETLFGGRTLGKLAVGLRVVRIDGGPIRFRHAFTRALVGVALEWPGLVLLPLTWALSLGTMLAQPQGRRIGDLAAGTLVIHDRTPAAWGWVPAMPPPLAGWAALLDLTGLNDELALAVRHFLARNRDITEPARSTLGRSLATEVAACTTPPPPPGVPGWAYLAAVLAERHRRAAHRLVAARQLSATVWLAVRPPVPALRPGADKHRTLRPAAPQAHRGWR